MRNLDNIEHIRIGLDEQGMAHYWPYDKETEDLWDEPMEAIQAIHLISGGKIPVVVACCDPHNSMPHNYESDAIRLKYI